jgi:hypothetical protein
MINSDALKNIKILEMEYERKWGKKVNYSIIPKGITQEKMVCVLEVMVKTGDSLLVAFNKYRESE